MGTLSFAFGDGGRARSEASQSRVVLRRETMGGDNIPKDVWSPSGGWYADPRGWRKNTAMAFGVVALVVIPLWMKSASMEKRHREPFRWIPSMLWTPTENLSGKTKY